MSAPSIPLSEITLPTGAPIVRRSGAAGGKSELSGTVQAGVESGCVVLADAGGAVLANLIGLDTTTALWETEAVVTGEFRPDLMTTLPARHPVRGVVGPHS